MTTKMFRDFDYSAKEICPECEHAVALLPPEENKVPSDGLTLGQRAMRKHYFVAHYEYGALYPIQTYDAETQQ